MRTAEYAALAFEIRSLTGVSTKLIGQSMEERINRHWPGISPPQYGAMRILEHHALTIKELSELMMLAPSTLVPIIDRLESEQLVVRGKDPDDRRRTPLELTARARLLLATVPPVDPDDRLSQAIAAMGLEHSRQLSQLLQRLVSELAGDDQVVQHILTMAARASERAKACDMSDLPNKLPSHPAPHSHKHPPKIH
jgi:DNA-binding MarR family transcriptional regulator